MATDASSRRSFASRPASRYPRRAPSARWRRYPRPPPRPARTPARRGTEARWRPPRRRTETRSAGRSRAIAAWAGGSGAAPPGARSSRDHPGIPAPVAGPRPRPPARRVRAGRGPRPAARRRFGNRGAAPRRWRSGWRQFLRAVLPEVARDGQRGAHLPGVVEPRVRDGERRDVEDALVDDDPPVLQRHVLRHLAERELGPKRALGVAGAGAAPALRARHRGVVVVRHRASSSGAPRCESRSLRARTPRARATAPSPSRCATAASSRRDDRRDLTQTTRTKSLSAVGFPGSERTGGDPETHFSVERHSSVYVAFACSPARRQRLRRDRTSARTPMVRHARRRAATAAFLVALLAVAGEGGAVDAPRGPGAEEKAAPSASSTRLRVVFDRLAGGAPDAHETNHLRGISRALASRDAFEIVRAAPPGSVPRVPAPSSATDADDVDAASEAFAEADVFWDFEPGDAPRALRAGQRANHFPGSGAMTSKATLATLRLEGPGAARVPATLAPDWSSPEDVRRAAADAAKASDAWLAARGRRRSRAETRTERIVDESSLASLLAATLARGDVAQRRVRRPLRVVGAPSTWACTCSRAARGRRRATASDGESAAGFPARAATSRWKKPAGRFLSRPSGFGGVRRRDPASLRGGRARGGRPARPRVPGGVGRADARSARGGFQTGRADGVARARARVGRAVRRRRGGGGQETRDGDHRRGDGRRRAVRRLGHSRRERERERERRKARAVPGPSRALLRDVPVRFRAGRRVGVRGRAPDPVARRGERVAQPEARQRAARRRPVPALRETRGQVNLLGAGAARRRGPDGRRRRVRSARASRRGGARSRNG